MSERNYQGGAIGIGLQGKYRVQVVDSVTNEIVSDYGWHKNLILNTGLDGVASNTISTLHTFGICGTGSRPNFFTSSGQAITQSGNYIGLNDYSFFTSFTQSITTNGTASYSSLVQIGDVVIDQDQSQSLVTGVSGSYLSVSGSSGSRTFATPKTFTIWKTSQTGLQGESKRSNTYYTGQTGSIWNCGSVVSASTATLRRTYTFAVETQTQSYQEVGVSWSGTANGPVFSRVMLPQTVSLSPAQQLRLTYDLVTTYGPTVSSSKIISIAGWPVAPSTSTSGTESQIQSFTPAIVDSNGGNTGLGSFGVVGLDPFGGSFYIFAVESTASAYTGSITYGSGTLRPGDFSTGGWTIGNYVTGSYTNTKANQMALTQAVLTDIRSIGFGAGDFVIGQFNFVDPNDQNGQATVFIFDQPQTKTNLQTLTLSWRWYWNRVIQ